MYPWSLARGGRWKPSLPTSPRAGSGEPQRPELGGCPYPPGRNSGPLWPDVLPCTGPGPWWARVCWAPCSLDPWPHAPPLCPGGSVSLEPSPAVAPEVGGASFLRWAPLALPTALGPPQALRQGHAQDSVWGSWLSVSLAGAWPGKPRAPRELPAAPTPCWAHGAPKGCTCSGPARPAEEGGCPRSGVAPGRCSP